MIKRAAPLAAAALLAAGCASADKTSSTAASAAAPSSSQTSGSGSMAGMNMASGSSVAAEGTKEVAAAKAVTVDGITAIPTQTLASTTWQGMRITAMAMTAVPFVIYNGTSEQEIKPTKKTSFHLMVMLSDAGTNEPVPYASVWATIRSHGKIVFDERQWPMISRYMGPHYGNDISVPGSGTYQMSLLVSPPVSARHVEYANVWLKPHRVDFTFHWSQPKT
jgi:uncharacterized protein involved in high-affinity Fe2+ transport